MTNEEIIEEMLHEAEILKLREHVLDLTKKILDLNPKMERSEAIKLSLNNAKLHSGIKSTK
jgi:hypothetical protein